MDLSVRINHLLTFGMLAWSLLTLNVALGQNTSKARISVNLKNTTTIEALKQIDALDSVKLSYNPDVISNQNRINKNFVNEPVESVLTKVLGESFDFKYRGSYIIIQKKAKEEAKKTTFTLAGGVKDAETGEVIPNVTIYEVDKLSSTLSDERGNFTLSVASKSEYVTFAISRENYLDTIIMVKNVSELEEALVLHPIKDKVEKLSDKIEIETKKLVQLFTTFETRINARNVRMEEERYFQLSLVPMVSNNGRMSGEVKNKLSVNLIAGYSYGLDGFEIGGLYNIERLNVRGLQMAGFGNAVGGRTNGVQLAGAINTNKGYTKGFQGAGAANVVTSSFKGVQASGFVNISKDFEGAQMTGTTNIAVGDFRGFQASGTNNHAGNVNGMQMTGVVNTAINVKGMQMSGFLNYAKKLNGVQLGVVNIADSVVKGAMIGLVNIAKNGKIELAVENNDVMDFTLAFRTGTNAFYSILNVGAQEDKQDLWYYGFGFGSQINLYKKLHTNLEMVYNKIDVMDGTSISDLNILSRFNVNFGYQFAKHFSLNAGPVLNIYVTDYINPETQAYGFDIAQNPFFNETDLEENINVSMWMGYAVSLRF